MVSFFQVNFHYSKCPGAVGSADAQPLCDFCVKRDEWGDFIFAGSFASSRFFEGMGVEPLKESCFVCRVKCNLMKFAVAASILEMSDE